MRRSLLSGRLALVLVLCLLATACAQAVASEEPIRLVLLISVDQLRPDRLKAELPGGLGRIVREGRRFENAALAHANTETCPGHATMLSGRHPGPSGIPSNSFVERDTLALRYCVDDLNPDAATFSGSGAGRSPRNLRVTTLGDWMKQQRPDTRVFSVSAKDRSAIMMGGQRPDGVYWLDWKGRGNFTTSRYYAASQPDWLDRWTRAEILDGLPEQWEHPTGDPPNGIRPDAFVSESTRFSQVSPHPLPGPLEAEMAESAAEAEVIPTDPAELLKHTLIALYFSPFVDEVTLRFARELVEREQLGMRAEPDLLALGLSGTDLVGHLYGPRSQEADDALHRLDRALASFLDFLDERVGRGRVLVVLTADHGVLPLPEWLTAQGTATCPVASGRISPKQVMKELDAEMASLFGEVAPPATDANAPATEAAPATDAKAPEVPPVGWLVREGYRLTVNRILTSERGVSPAAIVGAAVSFLSKQPGVEKVWTPEEFMKPGAKGTAELYRNSYDPERGGDVIIELAAGCLFADQAEGTTHGSPHFYDRAVPLVFAGPGVEPGSDPRPAATVDIAPSLAALLGIETPADLDGTALPLRR